MTIGSIRAGRRVVVASRVVVANIDVSSGEEDDADESSSVEYDAGDSSSDEYVVGNKKKVNGIKKKIAKSKRPSTKKRASRKALTL